MVREEFDEAFERLREESNRHAAVRRETDDWAELNRSRARLDSARSATTARRRKVVSRRDYRTPDAVPAGLGLRGLSGRGRWMTAFGAFAFLVITGALAVVAIKLSAADPLAVDGQIAETIEGDCVWRLEVPIRNDGDGPLTVIKFEVLIDARPTAFPYTPETVILQPGEHTTLDASRPMAPCPATPGDVEHGRLWLSWRDTGSSGNADILRVSF